MSDGNVTLLVAIVSALSAIGAAIVSFVSTRRKNSAEADALASAEWNKLYREMIRRLDEAEKKIHSLEMELDIARDLLQYIWMGTLENVHAMEQAGVEPPFKPQQTFRGNDISVYGDWFKGLKNEDTT
jgi:hypothetical protein